jgi:hypothetical protein
MLVTKGFRDVLEIGRTNRPVLYDIRTQKAPPLVPRTRAIEVDERVAYDGSILRDIDASAHCTTRSSGSSARRFGPSIRASNSERELLARLRGSLQRINFASASRAGTDVRPE